jgi:hypothetical protein
VRRSFVRALSAAALAIVLTAGTVFAAVESKVSLTIVDHVVFHGHVTSTKDACVVGRKVSLIRIEPDSSHQLVTTTFATESGHYSTTIPMQAGNRFFARVKKTTTPRGTVCLGDRSVTRTV